MLMFIRVFPGSGGPGPRAGLEFGGRFLPFLAPGRPVLPQLKLYQSCGSTGSKKIKNPRGALRARYCAVILKNKKTEQNNNYNEYIYGKLTADLRLIGGASLRVI